jgi:type VI secretion system protein ImpM
MSARAGWTGKLPSSGDFVSRRVPPAFAAQWEAWLGTVLAGSRERLGKRWQEAFLSAPAWRFVLAPEENSGFAGVMVPSVDSVGRYYPLTLVCELAGRDLDPEQALTAMENWFQMAEMLLLNALAPKTDIGALDDSIAALPLPPFPIGRSPASGERPKKMSAWSSHDSEVATGWSFQSSGMPTVDEYCGMLTGKPAQVAAAQ